jgi:hypothetical protein
VTRLTAGFSVGLALLASAAHAQDVASLAGRVVHKATQAGIPNAEVLLAPHSLRVVSDSAGHFQFDRVNPGKVSLLVRRLGFSPESASFEVRPSDQLDLLIQLEQAVQQLDTVNVAAREVPIVRGKLAAYYERKRFAIGRFIDSEILDAEQHRPLGEIITSRTAGSKLIRSKMGSTAWLATSRRSGAMFQGSVIDEYDRQRGADPRACYPDVYLDGAIVYSFGSRASLFDINGIPTGNVAAIEVYVGPSRIPTQYNKTSSVCGVVLIWTK